MNGDARECEAGDVHFLDRSPGVAQAVDRRFRDDLEPRRPQLLEQRAQRDAFACGELLEIREREAGHGDAVGGCGDLRDAIGGGRACRRRADDARFAGRRRDGDRRGWIGRNFGDAHERRVRPVALPAQAVGDGAEADDVVRRRQARELLFRNRHVARAF